ncbi:hypothetical protein GALMADRAFT_719591 [Galerina marginata CBS 339.88]|uniref:Uncharacterized protein n=1 Tax=Galerina marginata (strain CBS 339.88) TaxID=685588 RepID=A0A067TN81_GALM3|nr:hypothetical protein GALMADRAFT_719591 [Galerina marginata CBS 339.88]
MIFWVVQAQLGYSKTPFHYPWKMETGRPSPELDARFNLDTSSSTSTSSADFSLVSSHCTYNEILFSPIDVFQRFFNVNINASSCGCHVSSIARSKLLSHSHQFLACAPLPPYSYHQTFLLLSASPPRRPPLSTSSWLGIDPTPCYSLGGTARAGPLEVGTFNIKPDLPPSADWSSSSSRYRHQAQDLREKAGSETSLAMWSCSSTCIVFVLVVVIIRARVTAALALGW